MPTHAADGCLVATVGEAGTGTLRAALADEACAAIILGGPRRDLLTLDGQGNVRPLLVTAGTLALSGFTIAHGQMISSAGTSDPDNYGGGLAIRDGAVR